MKNRPTLVYYNRQIKDTIWWFCLSAAVGGVPLVVYFTTPRATWANLVLAGLLGIPCLVMSLRSLGKTTVIVVHSDEKKLRYVRSIYHKRETQEVDFGSVERIEWLSITLSSSSGSRGGGWTSHWNEIHVCLKNGERLVLQAKEAKLAEVRAKKLASVLGVQAMAGEVG